jgi:hypothetical protein
VARTVRTIAGAPVLYYLAIDGTEAQDAAVFGALLEGRGWKNLATTFLKPAPDDPERLVDPAHDFLSIPLMGAPGNKVAVVSPNGIDGTGLDNFWRRYPGQAKTPDGVPVAGRYAAAETSGRYMRQLILNPAIHTHELTRDVLSRHFAEEQLPYASRHAPAARLLYVSSHGWQSGSMRGDKLNAYVGEPVATAHEYYPETPYFLLGAAAASGQGFRGPEWIILAQCSTLNSGSWPFWARILGRSSPGVRGILAYEDGSPDVKAALPITERFFKSLDQGAPFLDAWIKANRYSPWAAIVHKEARHDTLRDFPRFRPLTDISTAENKVRYRGYLSSMGPSGEPVQDLPPPFPFKLENECGEPAAFAEVTPESLDTRVARFSGDHRYRLTVEGPPGTSLTEVNITAVNIRLSYQAQLNWNRLFVNYQGLEGAKLEGFETTTVTLRPARATAPRVALDVLARGRGRSGMQENHSYLWFRVRIKTDEGTLQHDFKNVGLS